MAKEIKRQNGINFIFILEKYFKVLLPVVFILVLIAGYFLVIDGQLKYYNNSKEIDLPNVMSENQRLISNKKNYKEIISKTLLEKGEEKLISMAVPDDFYFTSIVTQLTSLAKAYNFSVVSIDADKIKSAVSVKGINSIKINANVVGGDYNQFKSFLNGMENSAMIFDIQSISFSKGNSYQLEIIAYYFN